MLVGFVDNVPTVRTVEPLIEPAVAWIVVLPTATPVARPVAVIVATPVLLELHVTELVRFCVLLSLYVPVAVNCCVAPGATDGLAGVTASDTSAGAVTVRPVDPLIEPKVAWIVALPVATPVARPAAVMLATPVLLELHVTELVRFCVLLSLYVPVAVNCCVAPLAIDEFAGVTAIDTSGSVTVRAVEPLIAPNVAWIVVLPVATLVARPVAVMLATPVLLELHVTELVRFNVLLSL
jgi:type III secretory pathway component EscT